MTRPTQANLLVAAFAGSWLIVGILERFLAAGGHDPSETVLPHAVLLGFLAFAWCKAHAQSHGVPVPAYSPMVAGLAWPIGVPLYLFRAFPWRSALLGVIKAIGVAAISIALYVAGALIGGRVAA